MRIGIYNRHLTGVGGGEKHMLTMAEVLSRRHEVEVLTHHVLDLPAAGAQLGLELSRARLRSLEDRPDPELAPVTAEYDLFINASDGTFVPSRAKRSILLVYFPTPVRNTRSARLRWQLGHRLRRELMVPRYVAGFYAPEKLNDMTVRWTDGQARLEIPVPRRVSALRVRLTLTANRFVDPVRLFVDDRQVAECAVPTGHLTPVEVSVPVPGHGPANLEIATPLADGPHRQKAAGVGVADVEIGTARHGVYRRVFKHWFRELGQRLDALYPVLHLNHLDTYTTICANSEYTQRWIRRYWGKESVVFYPPVDVDLFEPLPKRRQILSVGRFFTTGHNKKHLVMIRAFCEMVAGGLAGWELHLAGGTSLGAANAQYLARVQAAAEGAPIRIHADISFDALSRLYGESAIYWHAAGYGENPQRHPVRYEHFGLTTVEAMAAGAVPVVIHGGGQPEIVTHGVDGFLWASLDDLRNLTGRLIQDSELRRRMATAARQRSRAFGRGPFEARLWQLLRDSRFGKGLP
ncbi:MAG: glycosyltransferase family 4 protein [Anaerolineae bacterium]